jgi:hypothetical protein
VSNSNPLTARVTVNRFWQLAFGTGIVKTSENFGLQGEHPSNPELLDWLASDFVRNHWDVKRFMKQIVMSATYCQSSAATPEQLKADPENRMLARGPRFRMPAELVRDLALSTSGLLVPTIGGPSVKIYQPAGLWEEISFRSQDFSEQNFKQDHGEKLWRRSLYTFWKRTCPPPTLQTFDAPEREFCIVKRNPTNTPLQALALMNDPCFVEASRKLAERLMKEAATPAGRIKLGYMLCVSRNPNAKEAKVFADLFASELKTFKADPKAAEKLLSVGEAPRDMKLDASELAAWTSVANVLLNMDEAITKG